MRFSNGWSRLREIIAVEEDAVRNQSGEPRPDRGLQPN